MTSLPSHFTALSPRDLTPPPFPRSPLPHTNPDCRGSEPCRRLRSFCMTVGCVACPAEPTGWLHPFVANEYSSLLDGNKVKCFGNKVLRSSASSETNPVPGRP